MNGPQRSRARTWRSTSAAAALLALLSTAACNDPAASATVLDLTVRFDDALALDQLRLTLTVDDADPFAPFVVPEAPRALASTGEALEVLLPDDVGGHGLTVRVEGLEGGEARAEKEARIDIVTGERTPLLVTLAVGGDACGDGVIDGAEQCDDGDTDDADGCDGSCAIEVGFTCTGVPSVCVAAACGDGALDDGEGCDDGDVDGGDGCSGVCDVEAGFVCLGAPSVCSETCGNGGLDDGEECDDGDLVIGDGCGDTCAVEPGFSCTGTPSICTVSCGDGVVDAGEDCDDEDLENGDGCSAGCEVESGFTCTTAAGAPSSCTPNCGNGALDGGEGCDDLNVNLGDGCSDECAVEPGFACTGSPSTCAATCNNGELDPGETCDDGGLIDGDGCSASCLIEDGYECLVAGQPCTTVCGDGFTRGAETCDDDDTDDGDGCSAACTIEAGFNCSGDVSLCVPGCTIAGSGDVVEGAPDPANPCRACRSLIADDVFSAVTNGTSCDDGVFCNGDDTCSAGACSSPGSPCSGTQPLCIEAADICSCAGSSCSNGTFCDGSETCDGTGNCQSGTPLDCSPEICSESASGCVECDDDTDCAAPNPSCFQQRCTECPTCPCTAGEHDGGGGECVPVGQCSAGFALGFLDADLDGIGAGPLQPDCDATPFGAGVSAVDTDCDDDDDAVFRDLSLFADDDLDTFTVANAVVECIGAIVPADRKLVANPPPSVSFQADDVSQTDVSGPRGWNDEGAALDGSDGNSDADVDLDNLGTSETLTISDFDLGVPAGATIRGVAVHVRRRVSNGNDINDLTISLVGGTGTSANRAVSTAWPSSFAEAVYGGPADLWGLSITAAQANAAGFGVNIAVEGDNSTARIEHVWIEVFTNVGADCNEASATTWSLRGSFTDGDADNFTVGSETDRCVGVSLPIGVSQISNGVDCFDANANARPGQTTFFTSNRGDGSFDYNCDGSQSKQSITQATLCTPCNTVTGTCTETTASAAPSQSCGATNASDDFCQNDGQCIVGGTDIGCSLVQDTATVRCR